MPIYDFNHKDIKKMSIDELPDHRSDVEKLYTPLAIFNPDKPDLALYERWAEEAINISGAWITLFLKQPMAIGEGVKSDHYDEDIQPQYRLGIKLKAYLKYNQWETELTRWGVDAPVKIDVVFSRAVLAKAVGLDRMIAPGDVVEAPYNRAKIDRPLRFRVVNENDMGNINYRWMYYSAQCELMTGDQSIQVPYENFKA